MHRAALVLILYALLPAKSEWKKIKLEYKQLIIFFFFCQKVTGQGKKPMLLFPFLNFMLWKDVSTSTQVCMCMYVCRIY